MNVNVKFGSEVFNRHYEEGATVGDVFADHDLKMTAGWGDNVRALVHSVEVPSTSRLADGITVIIETRANTKAS